MADVITNDVAQSDVDVVINEPRLTGEWPSVTIELGAGPQGRRGEKGDAYVLTDADKQEIAGELWRRMAAMSGCVSLHRVSIPEGVTSMARLFMHDYELSRVVVPDSVTSVGAYCFQSCYSLRHVHYPAGATSVPNYCFHGCHTLTGLELPEGVTSIGIMAFAGCFALGTLTIPSTVTSIGTLALLYGDGYEALHVKATTPPTMTDGTAGWPFSGVAIDAVIYVPYSADHSVLNAYLSATGWATLGDQLQEEAEA